MIDPPLLQAFDQQLEASVAGLAIPSAKVFMTEIRALLMKIAKPENHPTKPWDIQGLVRITHDKREGTTAVELGPTSDKGEEKSHFRFASGGRLCFGFTLKESGARSSILSARIHYCSRSGREFRYDVIPEAKHPLTETRAHYHWSKDLRLPAPAMHPRHVLEVICSVVDGQLDLHP